MANHELLLIPSSRKMFKRHTYLRNFFTVNPSTKYAIEVTGTSSDVFLQLLLR